MCCSGAPTGLGQSSRARIPAPGGSRRYALRPWPRSGRLLRHLCCASSLRRGANAEEAGVKAAQHRAARGPALTQERPAHYIALPWKEEEQRRSNWQRCVSAARVVESARPARRRQASWGFAGGLACRGRSTQPGQQKTNRTTAWSAASRKAPSTRGMGGERKQWHGRSAAAPVPSLCAPWGAEVGAQAQRPFERVCPHQGGQNSAWQPSGARGQSSGGAVSAAALTGPRAAAQTGVP